MAPARRPVEEKVSEPSGGKPGDGGGSGLGGGGKGGGSGLGEVGGGDGAGRITTDVVGFSGVETTCTPMNVPPDADVSMAMAMASAARVASARLVVRIVAVTVIDPTTMLSVTSSADTLFPAAAAMFAL